MKFNLNKKITANVLSSLAIALIFVACGGSKNESEGDSKNEMTNSVSNQSNAKAKKVFSTIPTPVETTKLLKDAGAKYNANILNAIENVNSYLSVKNKALNLGVYGSDLSFISLFDQTQESMLYLKCNNSLASSLGISGSFDENTTTRIQNNMDKKDSLLAIIEESFWNADKYLTSNGQPGVSALIVSGGWIEGMFIATKIAETTKNEGIIAEIGKQKVSLENLLDLLDSSKSDNSGVEETYKSLKGLKTVLDAAVPADGAKMTDDQFKQLSAKVAEIRNAVINTK